MQAIVLKILTSTLGPLLIKILPSLLVKLFASDRFIEKVIDALFGKKKEEKEVK